MKVNNSAYISATEGANVARILVTDSGSVDVANSKVGPIILSGTSRLDLYDGSDISSIWLSESSFASISPGSEISHVRLEDDASIEIRGGRISYINLTGHSSADVYDVELTGGSFVSENVRVKGGAFVLDPNAKLLLHGCSLSVRGGVIEGKLNGRAFKAWVILSDGDAVLPKYRLPKNQPTQLEFSSKNIPNC